MNEADKLDIATRDYIQKQSTKLIDSIFRTNPLWDILRTQQAADEPDEFDAWAKEVREKAGREWTKEHNLERVRKRMFQL